MVKTTFIATIAKTATITIPIIRAIIPIITIIAITAKTTTIIITKIRIFKIA